MPGILTNITRGQIVADPSRFHPFDEAMFEWISDDIAPDEDVLGAESGTSFMAGWVKNPDRNPTLLYDAAAYFIGYSEWDGSTQRRVNRHLPATNPRWPFHRCTQISVKGHEFDGQDVRQILFHRPWLPIPRYKRYRFDIQFAQPEYDVKPDGAIDTEWERFLTVDPTDEGEIITVDGGLYEYTSPAALVSQPVVINGPSLKVYAERAGLVVKSFGLPANFLLNQYNIGTHFLAAKGKVNSVEFLGQPRGTMLLQNYRFFKKAQPVATQNAGQLLFGLGVEMLFGYTDPERADAAETRRGWQLLPGLHGVLKWCGVRNKTDNSQDLYPYYDMNKLLERHDT